MSQRKYKPRHTIRGVWDIVVIESAMKRDFFNQCNDERCWYDKSYYHKVCSSESIIYTDMESI